MQHKINNRKATLTHLYLIDNIKNIIEHKINDDLVCKINIPIKYNIEVNRKNFCLFLKYNIIEQLNPVKRSKEVLVAAPTVE